MGTDQWRDELEIVDKVRLNGEYAKNLSLKMDIKCFLEAAGVFAKGDSVIEGARVR